jgi:uncharacterized membrane protein (GlpM family)
MHFATKLIITNLIIISCSWIGRRSPSFGGLIATMPLTTFAVLLWLYSDNPSDYQILTTYTRGVLWGIIPTLLFFLVLLFCFRRHIPMATALAAALLAWIIGAISHYWYFR